MNQIEKLNKDLSMFLNEKGTRYSKGIKRVICFDPLQGIFPELTPDELFLIKETLINKLKPCGQATIVYISRRYYLDFIGWDNPKFHDVLICKSKG